MHGPAAAKLVDTTQPTDRNTVEVATYPLAPRHYAYARPADGQRETEHTVVPH